MVPSSIGLFSGNYHKQLEGVTMEFPLGQALGNAFYVIMKENGLESVQLHML